MLVVEAKPTTRILMLTVSIEILFTVSKIRQLIGRVGVVRIIAVSMSFCINVN